MKSEIRMNYSSKSKGEMIFMGWYALFVETGQEEIVQRFLQLYFDKLLLYTIVPKRIIPERKEGKVKHVIKKIFPGYILIRTEMNAEVFHKIKNIPHCHRLLTNGKCYSKDIGEYYSKIDQEEISPLLKLIGNGEIIDYSEIILENSRVLVKSGPLQGLENIIKKIDKRKNRAKIILNFIGTEKVIDVGIKVISKTN